MAIGECSSSITRSHSKERMRTLETLETAQDPNKIQNIGVSKGRVDENSEAYNIIAVGAWTLAAEGNGESKYLIIMQRLVF